MKRNWFGISVLILLLSADCFAQTNRGGIRGTVTDSSGAVVPSAAVVVTNLGTNQAFRVITSRDGAYGLQNLDPVTYRVEVEAAGFEKAVRESIKVNTGSTATADFVLRPGNITTQVVVSSEAPLLNQESGTLGTTISERMLTDLPLANRSVLDLAVTTPNVSGDVGSEDPSVTSGVPTPGFNLSVNGGRPGTSEMLADGVSNTGVGLAREVVAFSPETVQEFTVETSAFSAQYGTTGGGIISVSTKSGTNQFHGGASWYNRNPITNANPWTNSASNRPVNNLRWNQASFDIGGPVLIPKIYNGHDKTFFFFAFEPRWQGDKLQEYALLPTDQMRKGDFSGLTALPNGWAPTSVVQQFGVAPSGNSGTIYQQYQLVNGSQFQALPTPSKGNTYPAFPNNVIPPNMLDSVSLKLLQYMPEPGSYFVDGNGFLENYALNRFVQSNHQRYTTRIDEALSTHDHLSFRFTDVPEIGTGGFGSPINGSSATYSSSRQYVGAYTRTISPFIYNDLRLNYTNGRFSGTFQPQYDISTGQNLSTQLGLPSLTHGGLPLVTFDTLSGFADIGSENSQLNDNTEQQYQIADNLYISHGNMTWTTGILLDHEALNVMNFYAAAGGRYQFRFLQTDSNGSDQTTGNSFASFLLGVPNIVDLKNSLIPYHYRWNNLAAFVQNDWKVRPNLTLNLGVRYSLQGPREEGHNYQGIFLPSLAQAAAVPAGSQTVKLANGQPFTVNGQPMTISSITVPPFAYSGIAGRSAHLTPVNWQNFEPRFGFAYSPHLFGLRNLVIRGGYGISHLPYTGQNRQPNPDFSASTLSFNPTTGQTDSTYIMRLCCNPPFDPPIPVSQIISPPSNGVVTSQSIDIPGFALSENTKTPYVQNWELSVQRQLGTKMMLEVAYSGAKGTHLFFPAINTNPYNAAWAQTLLANNYNPATTRVLDPLGRTGPPSCKPSSSGPVCKAGSVLQIDAGTLMSNYVGFDGFLSLYDASANSIRHAVYVNFTTHANHGLTLLANYSFSKSLDNASTASPDKNVLTTSNLPGGQITYGGTPKGDRALSTFDTTHQFNASFIYDFPLGRGRSFLSHAPWPVQTTIGGWTVSGVERLFSGFPMLATESTTYLAPNTYATHDIRPYLVPGVPLRNPLYDPHCIASTQCEPYLNPAAFMETPAGGLGNAPRTLDLRGPWQQNLDLSLQKNFQITEKVRLQFRVDAINVLNHPLFRSPFGNGGGTGSRGIDIFGGEPTTTSLTTAQYNSWASFNSQPTCGSKTCTGADPGSQMYQGIITMVNAQRQPSGALPPNFFTVPLPSGFALTNPNSFNITTLDGYKLYRVRQDFNTNFGQLYYTDNERYLQFALRVFF